MPKKLTITIQSVCLTNPPHPHMSLSNYDEVTWHAAPPALYYLALPGGVFEGFPNRFVWPVFGATPTIPLTLVDPLPSPIPPIFNYINDPLGNNCQTIAKTDPPDVIIDSGARPEGKAKKKKK
jgi:hypothetical protein